MGSSRKRCQLGGITPKDEMRFEVLKKQLTAMKRQLVAQFMEDLLGLRSERIDFATDAENGYGSAAIDLARRAKMRRH